MSNTKRLRGRYKRMVAYTAEKERELDLRPLEKPCPTPHKVSYPARKHAKEVLRLKKVKFAQTGEIPKPYLCVCGCWHLGKPPMGRRPHPALRPPSPPH